MAKLLPIALVALGLGAGAAAGLVLKPGKPVCDPEAPEKTPEACAAAEAPAAKETYEDGKTEFAELKRQFVVPIVRDEKVEALVVASLSVEIAEGGAEHVYSREPKLRDAFLNVLFVHAHSGGFDGAFTSRAAMADLKARLVEVARPVVGEGLRDVLITEIVRQDL
ncbi:flagellar basal body-associated protein FliL [Rhodobacteraceae bacterium 2CG4]|uniref:Flagellar protein FliL n=1 Tax=Halovulum marinum TaxID=2662447 RepID=A0A6L5Z5I9_9RHOB|nr:flagellar basal body-associated FliL family protein [Halovulum marinum]MSU91803.1 flagellar basal body-associated protein FliL [Halovulum marinum]